jgi:hypothetical protein
MTDSKRRILRGFSFVDFFLLGWLAIQFVHLSEINAWAGSLALPKSIKAAGNAERGRAVFNGKLVCPRWSYAPGTEEGMEPDDLLCSRNARPRKALVGRAQ